MTGPSAEALQAAGRCLAEAELGIRRDSVEEAARRSYGYRSGHVSLTESMAAIEAIRAQDHQTQHQQSA